MNQQCNVQVNKSFLKRATNLVVISFCTFVLWCYYLSNMGACQSKSDKIKRNKNHNRQKMFRFGVSFGRNDLNLEGHLQMGYNSKTVKNYGPIEKQLVAEEKSPLAITETGEPNIESQTVAVDA